MKAAGVLDQRELGLLLALISPDCFTRPLQDAIQQMAEDLGMDFSKKGKSETNTKDENER